MAFLFSAPLQHRQLRSQCRVDTNRECTHVKVPRARLVNRKIACPPPNAASASGPADASAEATAATAAASTAASRRERRALVERCTASDWRTPLRGNEGVSGDVSHKPVVALGKFDALHRGHMALAAAAARLGGAPILLSFSGMADVLGWPQRLPLVPPCDRSRVLALWAQEIAGALAQEDDMNSGSGSSNGSSSSSRSSRSAALAVRQRYVPFACVRHLSPEAFVEVLAGDLGASGVVAGENYRFGYKASGDAAALRRLSAEMGMRCATVDLVAAAATAATATATMSVNGDSSAGDSSGGVPPPVSSSMIRELLAAGHVDRAAELLGRPYRLVGAVALPGPAGGPTSGSMGGGSSSSSGGSSSSGDDGGQGGALITSTSGMDGQDSEAAPLRLVDGGLAALVAQAGLLNASPGPGSYEAAVVVHAGASPADELLALEEERSGGGGGGSGSDPVVVPPATSMIVELSREGLKVPAAALLRAASSGAGRALVVVDFVRRRVGGGGDSGEE